MSPRGPGPLAKPDNAHTYLRVFDHREVLEREREREGRISFVGGYGDSSNELMQVELVLGIEITTVLLAKVVSRDT